ncbi:MAG TPA: serine/threonine-protein kinase [Planctomycetota bacterium]|nr:serine/threonine-protein kinase [Planctomycetota bacterium]
MANEPQDQGRRQEACTQLEELIIECLDRIETDGDRAVDAVCERHPALAHDLRSRMSVLRAAGLLESPGGGATPAFPERLGDFRLLAHLGGGGMGVVYLARQESLGREVALKLIRPEHLYFPGARERFRREVESVARLAHPGIVPIYTVGEERGIPYFAMERVAGCTIGDVLGQLQARPPSTLEGADFDRAIAAHTGDSEQHPPAAIFAGRWIEACLRVVREVADALEHVHRRGVLHRDIKASNVMLTRTGRVMVVDFGLSSAEGGDRLTKTGSQIGSLAYMAPEQVRGDIKAIDARSDVYSLAVTLYELLTLRMPFADDKLSELRRKITEGRPVSPRSLNPAVDWDVETVCLHAMEADPQRRYASAAEFAHDLSNALEHRPIVARRASAFGRVVRWTRRKPALALASLLAFVLATVLPTALYLQQRAANLEIAGMNTEINETNRSLSAALLDARAQRVRAEDNLVVAMEAVDRMLSRVGAQDLEQVPQLEPVRARLLEDALALNERLAAREGDDGPEARATLAETRRRAGDIYHWLGRFEEAERLLERAIAERRELLAADASNANRVGLANALTALARTQRSIGKNEASAASSREAIALLAELPAEADTGLRLLEDRALATHFLATTLLLLGQIEPALAAHRDAIAVARQVFARSPTPDHEAMVAGNLGAMGGSLLELRRNKECGEALTEARTIFDRVLPHVEDAKSYKENLGDVCTNLGVLHQNEGDLTAAAPHFERAFELYRELARDFPNSPRYLDSLNAARTNLATILNRDPGTRARALQLLSDAIAGQEQLVASFPTSVEYRTLLALMVGNLGAMRVDDGQVAEGCKLLARAVEQHLALRGELPDNPVVESRLANFAFKLTHGHLSSGDSRAAAASLHAAEAELTPAWRTLRRLAGQAVDISGRALEDPALAPAERERLSKELLEHAIELMEKSVAAGYRDTDDLEQGSKFEPLRDRPRFKVLQQHLRELVK